jgi:hypothetical protein
MVPMVARKPFRITPIFAMIATAVKASGSVQRRTHALRRVVTLTMWLGITPGAFSLAIIAPSAAADGVRSTGVLASSSRRSSHATAATISAAMTMAGKIAPLSRAKPVAPPARPSSNASA